MTKNNSSPIKSYQNKVGKTLYMFRVFLGTDELTGKAKNTTRRGFKTKKEAELALARIKLQVSEGTYKQRSAETYQEVYDLWITQYEKTVEESTFVKTVGYFKNHILPAMGTYRIEKITIAICQKHYNEWASKVQKARTIKSYAKKVLDFAIIHGLIQTNPFTHVETKIKKPFAEATEQEHENFYTKDELILFLDHAKEHLDYKAYAVLRLIAYTGMRKSEALALTWNDVNFIENELTINKAIGRGKQTKLYLKTTKTSKPRTIKLDDTTLSNLKEWNKLQKQQYIKLGINTIKKNQLIFSNTKNEFLQPVQVQKWMYSVQNKYQFKRVSPHGLRHTHCSLLFEAGASIKEVQDRLGHSDVKTTLDIYTHVTKKAKEDAIQKFVSYLES
ncbi:site-specific integrase [Lysinibacillus fusiformis]|uniref:site-specific integrase n=1 Tax=Lysinibacillus fusiformis TaxID=28031 RepID=UPI0023A9E888|nr:site-specific integrase [Lysinibacillus fusiformis]WEA38593.1 site-specific integrase [Lysinibacillus fusiformis]